MATVLSHLEIGTQYRNEGGVIYIAIAESVQQRSEPVDSLSEKQASWLQYPACLMQCRKPVISLGQMVKGTHQKHNVRNAIILN